MKVDAIVRDICAIYLNDGAATQYIRVLRAVNIAIGELFSNLLPVRKSILVSIPENLTIPLPPDCGVPLKVGVLCDRKLTLLPKNDRIRVVDSNPCSCAKTPEACLVHTFVAPSEDHVLDPYFGEQYTVPQNIEADGAWNLNMAANRVELRSGRDVFPGATLLLEYKQTDMETQDVPNDCAIVLHYRVSELLMLTSSPGASQYSRSLYQAEWRRLKTKYLNYSVEDWVDSVKGSVTSGVKF